MDFFTREDIKGMYKGFVETIVNRVNTINGRTYKEDPTIMAWVSGARAGTAGRAGGVGQGVWGPAIMAWVNGGVRRVL